MPKILVIDDEEKVRKVITLHLTKAGYEVIAVENGFEALKDLEKIKPDLIITDIMMPKVNGLEFGEAIRNRAETSNIPFIIISARCDENTVQKARDLGASRFIAKPFGMKTLIASIEKVLEEKAKR